MGYTVKKVADLAGVTVRALHHYDQIGLLRPSSVSESGYRLYSDADLERLQQILFFRELGFSLSDIKNIVNSPGFDRKEALLEHRKLLEEKKRRIDGLIESVDKTLESIERNIPMEEKEMFGAFDRKQAEEYREEARRRWGSERVDESWQRVSKLSKQDWADIQAEGQEILEGIAARMGRDPADPEVQGFIERHYNQINERFYTCPVEVYRGLGDLYVDDPRFTAFYDKVRPGLAAFMRKAMHVYCDRISDK